MKFSTINLDATTLPALGLAGERYCQAVLGRRYCLRLCQRLSLALPGR